MSKDDKEFTEERIDKTTAYLLNRSLNTGRLIAFIGSGINIPYAKPSWDDMVIHLGDIAIERLSNSNTDTENQKEKLEELAKTLEIQLEQVKERKADDNAKRVCLGLSQKILDGLKSISDKQRKTKSTRDSSGEEGDTNPTQHKEKNENFQDIVRDLFFSDETFTKNNLQRRLTKLPNSIEQELASNVYKNPKAFYSDGLLKRLHKKLEGQPSILEHSFFSDLKEIGGTFELKPNLDAPPPETGNKIANSTQEENAFPADRRSFFAVVIAASQCMTSPENSIAQGEISEHLKGIKHKAKLDLNLFRADIDPLGDMVSTLGINRFLTTNYDLELEKLLESHDYAQYAFNDENEPYVEEADSIQVEEHARGFARSKTTIMKRSRRGRLARSMVFEPDSPQELIEFAVRTPEIHTDILHLHGRCRKGDPVVVTEDDYQKYYHRQDGPRQTVQDSLDVIFGGNPIIFIGVGLNEEDVMRPLRRFVAQSNGKRSRPLIALMPAIDTPEALTAMKLSMNMQYGVHVMFYGEEPKHKNHKGPISLFDERRLLEKLRSIFNREPRTADIPEDVALKLKEARQAANAADEKDNKIKEALDKIEAEAAKLSIIKSRQGRCIAFLEYIKRTYDIDLEKNENNIDDHIDTLFPRSTRIDVDKISLKYVLRKSISCSSTDARFHSNVFKNDKACKSIQDFLERIDEKSFSFALTDEVSKIAEKWRTWWQEWRRLPSSHLALLEKIEGFGNAFIDGETTVQKQDTANLEQLSSRVRQSAGEDNGRSKEFIKDFHTCIDHYSLYDVPAVIPVLTKDGAGSGNLLNDLINNKPSNWQTTSHGKFEKMLFINITLSIELTSVMDLVIEFIKNIIGDNEPSYTDERHLNLKDLLQRLPTRYKWLGSKRHLLVINHFDLLLDRKGIPFSGTFQQFMRDFQEAAINHNGRLPLDILLMGSENKLEKFNQNSIRHFYKKVCRSQDYQALLKLNGPHSISLKSLGKSVKPGGIDTEAFIRIFKGLFDKNEFDSIGNNNKDRFCYGFKFSSSEGNDFDNPAKVATLGKLVYDIWKHNDFSYYSLIIILACLRDTCFEPTKAEHSMVYLKLESAHQWLTNLHHTITANVANRSTGIIIEAALSRYTTKTAKFKDKKNERVNAHAEGIWRVHESFFIFVLRHIAAANLPMDKTVLANAKEIREFYEDYKKEIDEEFKTEDDDKLSQLIDFSLENLERRCLILPVQPRQNDHTSKKHYTLHRHMAEHIERNHGSRIVPEREIAFYDLNNYFEAPKELPALDERRYLFLTGFARSIIQSARDKTVELRNGLKVLEKDREEGKISTQDFEHSRDKLTPDRHTITECLRTAMGILRTNFSISTLSRLPPIPGILPDDSKGVFEQHQDMIRHIIDTAKKLEKVTIPSAPTGAKDAAHCTSNTENKSSFYDEEIAWLYNERALLAHTRGSFFEAQSLNKQTYRTMSRYAIRGLKSPARKMQALGYFLLMIEKGRIVQAQAELEIMEPSKHDKSLSAALTLGLLGRVNHAQGRLSIAEKYYIKALEQLTEQARPRGIAYFARLKARLHAVKTEYKKAKECIEEAKAAAERSRQDDLLHYCRIEEAILTRTMDENQTETTLTLANAKLSAALKYAERMGLHELKTRALYEKAKIDLTLGDTKAAGEMVREGLILATTYGMTLQEAAGTILMGHVSLIRDNRKIGLDLLRLGRRKAEHAGYQLLVERAQQIIVATESGPSELLRGETGLKLSTQSYIGY